MHNLFFIWDFWNFGEKIIFDSKCQIINHSAFSYRFLNNWLNYCTFEKFQIALDYMRHLWLYLFIGLIRIYFNGFELRKKIMLHALFCPEFLKFVIIFGSSSITKSTKFRKAFQVFLDVGRTWKSISWFPYMILAEKRSFTWKKKIFSNKLAWNEFLVYIHFPKIRWNRDLLVF